MTFDITTIAVTALTVGLPMGAALMGTILRYENRLGQMESRMSRMEGQLSLLIEYFHLKPE